MNKLIPLMQREWLQHRFGWLMMAVVPLGLALLLLSFGQVQFESGSTRGPSDAPPELLALVSIAGSAAVLFVIAWFASLIIVSGMARRDHADRSIEFWLSVPTTHSASLAAPLFVHLLLVPAAALVVGMAGGWLLSLVLVGRFLGLDAWFGLPWLELLAATLSLTARLLAGLPLATLWLLPMILLVVLLTAWFGRWGWVILGVGLGLGGQLLDRLFGQPLISQISLDLLQHAGKAMISAGKGFAMGQPEGPNDALSALPAWALHDFGFALRDLASPLLLGGLLFSAGCFALLVQWRQRGAGAAG